VKSFEKQERRSSLTKEGVKDEKAGRKALLQKFIETQMHSVVTSLHEEVPLPNPPPLMSGSDLEVLAPLEGRPSEATTCRGGADRVHQDLCHNHLAVRQVRGVRLMGFWSPEQWKV
jgi:hypothetical protein